MAALSGTTRRGGEWRRTVAFCLVVVALCSLLSEASCRRDPRDVEVHVPPTTTDSAASGDKLQYKRPRRDVAVRKILKPSFLSFGAFWGDKDKETLRAGCEWLIFGKRIPQLMRFKEPILKPGFHVLTDVDDTLTPLYFGVSLFDNIYPKNVIYPGAAQMFLELSREKHRGLIQPFLLTARSRPNKSGQSEAYYRAFQEVAKMNSLSHTISSDQWGIDFQDSKYMKWPSKIWSRGKRKARNFGNLETEGKLSKAIFFGDNGDQDEVTGDAIKSRDSLHAVFIHDIKRNKVYGANQNEVHRVGGNGLESNLNDGQILYFRNYIHAAVLAKEQLMLDNVSLRNVVIQAYVDVLDISEAKNGGCRRVSSVLFDMLDDFKDALERLDAFREDPVLNKVKGEIDAFSAPFLKREPPASTSRLLPLDSPDEGGEYIHEGFVMGPRSLTELLGGDVEVSIFNL